jgi:serine phosphatase RsbU (regulator of sigma subunit)/pSer/pThr/pTyr-binding forkhead associated (FHA) protein
LKVLKGDEPGRVIEIRGERTVLGRHPNSQVVFDNAAVSRHHAQILESHGTYYLEDLRSRNGTYVNGQPLDSRTQLRDGDQIRICDIVLDFYVREGASTQEPSQRQAAVAPQQSVARDTLERATAPGISVGTSALSDSVLPALKGDSVLGDESASSIISKVDPRRTPDSFRISSHPDIKLKAILEISHALRRQLEIDAVLPKILASLFSIFPQADQGFILLKDPETRKLRVKATRTRRAEESGGVAVSMTVVRKVLESGEALLCTDVLDDSRFQTASSLTELQIRSMMCVPLTDSNLETLGVIQLDTRTVEPGFTSDDLDLLVSVAAQAEMALENARLHEEVLRQREMERDLDVATQVQLGFLPKERPKIAGYAFADYYEAALHVGGDYFDYISMPEGRLAVALGDVAGKGMPAALLMARLYSSTRFQLFTAQHPARALTELNKDIAASGLGHRFITFVMAVLDPPTGELTVVNAGHLPPFLRRRDGTVEYVAKKESGLPLGIVPDYEYQSVAVKLQPGDRLIAFTDGVTEAMNDERVIYGRERLKRCVSQSDEHIGSLIKAIISDVETFSGGGVLRDDTCCVGLERLDTDPTTTR